jgi:hypothetical protein
MVFEANNPTTSPANAYLSELLRSLDSRRATIDWLVVSDGYLRTLQNVLKAINSPSTSVVSVPPASWSSRNDALVAAIQRAITEVGLKHLLLVGQSDEGSVDRSRPMRNGGQPTIAENRLLTGAVRAQTSAQRAKDQFRSRLLELCDVPAIREAISKRQLQLHGLYHLNDSGNYLVFDFSSQSFKPLAPIANQT